MMNEDWIEIEGKSKDDVLERACNALNTTLNYLEFESMGKGGKKIRARKASEPQNHKITPKAEKIPSDKQPESNESGILAALAPKKGRGGGKRKRNDNRNDRGGNRSRGGRGGNNRSERNDRNDRQENFHVAKERAPKREMPVEEPEELIDPTEMGTNAKKVLSEILGFIDAEKAEVSLEESENNIKLEIESDGSGLFIGKHGQTLEAFQHIVAKCVGLDRNSDKRLTLDSGGYRERRKESLMTLADRLANKVMRSKRSNTLEPMSAMDRRIIHMALAEHDGVETKSVGEGVHRKVVIVPKGGGRRARGGERSDNRGSRGGNGRSGNSSEGSGNRSRGARNVKRAAKLVTGARKHDSFDVPAAPKMDMFPDDIDSLMDVPEEEMQERLKALNLGGSGEE